MTDGLGLLIIFGFFLAIGLIPAAIASSKGRSFLLWWPYGAALFLIALIHALVMKPTRAIEENRRRIEGQRKCPHCAEWIKAEAIACRHCGRDVEPKSA